MNYFVEILNKQHIKVIIDTLVKEFNDLYDLLD